MTRRRFSSLLFVIFLGMAVGLPVQASCSLTREQIREARHNDEIKPLRWILRQIHEQYPGRVLDADLVQKHGQYMYKIRILQAEGYITKLTVDANTAQVLHEKSRQSHRRK